MKCALSTVLLKLNNDTDKILYSDSEACITQNGRLDKKQQQTQLKDTITSTDQGCQNPHLLQILIGLH